MTDPVPVPKPGPSIGRASAALASGTLVSRILGFLKAILLAQLLGVNESPSADAFALANQMPNTIYAIVAGGVLSAVLVPQIVRAALHADGGRGYINKLLTLAFVVLAAATAVAVLIAPLLVRLYANSGTTGFSEDQLALATAFAYWCLPQILFYGLYTVLGEVLNAKSSFGPYTWAPVINNVLSIAGLITFVAFFGAGSGERPVTSWGFDMIILLAGSATLGVAAQAFVLFFFWRRIGISYRPDFRWRGVGLGAAGKMASWTFGMLLLTSIGGLVESRVASIATGHGPSIFALQTGWLVFILPHSVIAFSIATAYFTRMSEHAARDDRRALRANISSSIRTISAIIVFATVGLMVVAYPFSGLFTHSFADAASLGNVTIAFLFGLPAFVIVFVIQRAFYALGDTRTPFFFTLFQIALFSIGAVACILLPLQLIAVGIAVATSIAGTLEAVLAAYLLRRRLGGFDGKRIVQSLVRFLVAALPAAIVGYGLVVALGGTHSGGFASGSAIGAVVSMAGIAVAMGIVYFGMLRLMRSSELAEAIEPLMRRFKR